MNGGADGLRQALETIVEAIAARVAERIDLRSAEARIAKRVSDELRADAQAEWVSPAAFARARGLSADTVARRIAAGDLEVQEFARVPLKGRDGKQLRDKKGRPRWRRTLRVRLTRRPTDAEIGAIAAAEVRR